MSTEELMKVRYKVIADYPGMDDFYKIGEIIQPRYPIHYGSYPHIFKKLEWWEERKESDMPQYVKSLNTTLIYKVFHWVGTQKLHAEGVNEPFNHCKYLLPAHKRRIRKPT